MRALAPSVWHHRATETSTPSPARRGRRQRRPDGWPLDASPRRHGASWPPYKAISTPTRRSVRCDAEPLALALALAQLRICDRWSRGPAMADPRTPALWGPRRHAGSPASVPGGPPAGDTDGPDRVGPRRPCNPMYKYSEAGSGRGSLRACSRPLARFRGCLSRIRRRGTNPSGTCLAALPAFPALPRPSLTSHHPTSLCSAAEFGLGGKKTRGRNLLLVLFPFGVARGPPQPSKGRHRVCTASPCRRRPRGILLLRRRLQSSVWPPPPPPPPAPDTSTLGRQRKPGREEAQRGNKGNGRLLRFSTFPSRNLCSIRPRVWTTRFDYSASRFSLLIDAFSFCIYIHIC
jgi:hypothetical protein